MYPLLVRASLVFITLQASMLFDTTCQADYQILLNTSSFTFAHLTQNSTLEAAGDGPASNLNGSRTLSSHESVYSTTTSTTGGLTSTHFLAVSPRFQTFPADGSFINATIETQIQFEILDRSSVNLTLNANPLALYSEASSLFTMYAELQGPNGAIGSLHKRSDGVESTTPLSMELDPGVYTLLAMSVGDGFQATLDPISSMNGSTNGTVSLSITAVPEPSSIISAALLSFGLLYFQRKRWKKA